MGGGCYSRDVCFLPCYMYGIAINTRTMYRYLARTFFRIICTVWLLILVLCTGTWHGPVPVTYISYRLQQLCSHAVANTHELGSTVIHVNVRVLWLLPPLMLLLLVLVVLVCGASFKDRGSQNESHLSSSSSSS